MALCWLRFVGTAGKAHAAPFGQIFPVNIVAAGY
jgi:hypothetical protein